LNILEPLNNEYDFSHSLIDLMLIILIHLTNL